MKVYKKMRPVGVLLWFSGCFRMHKDGDGFSGIFRAWHPLTWLALLAMVVPCAVMGMKLTDVVPLKLSRFWLANRNQLQRVTPFTAIETLKPFDHRAATLSAPSGQ